MNSLAHATHPAQPLMLRADRDGVATLTLNRPAQRNALSLALITELLDAVEAIGKDRSIRAVVIAANGPVFSSGHDLKELRANPGRQAYEALFGRMSQLMLALTRLPQPVIAKVHGVATAAGCQLVATCDLAVASDDALFCTPGVNIGLFCSTPMVALTRAVGRKPAMEMLLTGEAIDAETALRIGLINRIVAPEALDGAVDALLATILAKSPLPLAIGKSAFYAQAELGLDAAYAYAGEAMTRNMMARDAEEGIDAFLAKRAPKWEGR